jgi:hypothetical protein
MTTEINLPPLPPHEGTMTLTYGLTNKVKVPMFTADQMRAYALAAVAHERDACADICAQHASVEGIAQRCAAAIRARGQE